MYWPTTALALCAASVASASNVYRYVEADGTVVYTNVRPGGAQKVTRLTGGFRPAPSRARALRVTAEAAEQAASYASAIASAARRYRIPEALVKAIMHAESGFDPLAVSTVGASGLMQLMPATAREMYVKDLFNAEANIEGGVRYLRVLANEFDGDMVKMVAAYNAGPDAVRKYGGRIPPYFETQTYVRRVLALYYEYKSLASRRAGVEAASP